VMVVVHVDAGLSRPLEGSQALQWLPIQPSHPRSGRRSPN
jgi:hypothetical protein